MRLLFPFILMANLASAQEVTTDAFGILPTEHLGDRANWAGLRETSDGESEVQLAGPTDATVLFVGPKSIVAGIEPGHAVALGLDVHGNMISGAQAHFGLGFGGGVEVETQYGIADVLFTPPPRAGVFLAGTTIGGVQSARADYRVTAHLATVLPRFENDSVNVRPETFGVISTSTLFDAYGNTVDDGVGISIILTDELGTTTFLPSMVRDTSARSTLLARDLTGEATGILALAGTGADGLTFAVEEMVLADVGAFLVWAEPSIAAVQVRLGPLATTSGYLVPDGTSASVEVETANGIRQSAQGWVLDGYVSFVFALSPETGPFNVSLSITGTVHAQQIELSAPPENTLIRGAE